MLKYIETIEWFTSLFKAVLWLVPLALVIKLLLIEPYSITLVQFEIQFEEVVRKLKGDKEI